MNLVTRPREELGGGRALRVEREAKWARHELRLSSHPFQAHQWVGSRGG